MLKKDALIDDAPAAPALTPDLVSKIRKEDMKQAVVERFSGEASAPRKSPKVRTRSPYWQPADDQC